MTGYSTYKNAHKRGEEVAKMATEWARDVPKSSLSWLVIAKPDGRFVPAFNVNNYPGGPGPFLGLVNICVFN